MFIPYPVKVGRAFKPCHIDLISSLIFISTHVQGLMEVPEHMYEEAKGKPFPGFGSAGIFEFFDHGKDGSIEVFSFSLTNQFVEFLAGAMTWKIEVMPGRGMFI